MILDNGLFYEFIPYNSVNFDSEGNLLPKPEILTIAELRPIKSMHCCYLPAPVPGAISWEM